MISQLLGVTDIAEELGWSKGKVSTYRSRGIIPEPIAEIGGRPVWLKSQIEKVKRERN